MPQTDRGRRIGAAAGILFVILALVAIFLPGDAPNAEELNNQFTEFLTDKRGKIVASDYILGFGLALFLVFLGALRNHLTDRSNGGVGATATGAPGAARVGVEDEDRTLTNAAIIGGSVGAALLLAGAAVANGVAFKVAEAGDDALNRALFDVSTNLYGIAGFPLAVFFAAAGLAAAANRTFPAWLAMAGPVVAVLHLVGAISLIAEDGFFSYGEVYSYIPPLASLVWILAASFLMFRGPGAATGAPAGATRIAERPTS
jgi:hypothetical protein